MSIETRLKAYRQHLDEISKELIPAQIFSGPEHQKNMIIHEIRSLRKGAIEWVDEAKEIPESMRDVLMLCHRGGQKIQVQGYFEGGVSWFDYTKRPLDDDTVIAWKYI